MRMMVSLAVLVVHALVAWPAVAAGRGSDGPVDPAGDAAKYLQKPDQALRELPAASGGNGVDWVAALRRGAIQPRAAVQPGSEMSVLDLNVRMRQTASMPHVTFPHLQHTQWLGCENCHPAIFLPQKDANPVTMYGIVQGKYCGVCHGTVAFPAAECARCHNTPKPGGAG